LRCNLVAGNLAAPPDGRNDMTIATPGTNTSVDLDWTTTEVPDGRVRHFAVRAPWTFCVTEYPAAAKSRNTELVAHHPDGRGGTTLHAGADAAKAYALTRLHPSEAMVWLSEKDFAPGVHAYTASWGPLYFTAVRIDGAFRFGFDVDGVQTDTYLEPDTLDEAKDAATDVLIDHYGPVRPVVDVPLPSDPQGPAERISEAFADLIGHDAPDVGTVQEALWRARLTLLPEPTFDSGNLIERLSAALKRPGASVSPAGIREALDAAAIVLSAMQPVAPLSPEERLSRALAASFWTKRSADEVAELLRRAGLSLS
jgi:hypothetical protein